MGKIILFILPIYFDVIGTVLPHTCELHRCVAVLVFGTLCAGVSVSD